MWRRLALAALAVAWQSFWMVGLAQAQNNGIDCDAFLKNPDGSWTVISKVFIPVQNVKVVEGTVFRPGGTFLGDDMAKRLEKECPNKQVEVPVSPAEVRPQYQPPRVSLLRFADANGSIDVQRLSCGQLADSSLEEAELFLAWYSGWFNGAARRRGINLARVRYASRGVVEYCKANRDKNLVQVMELMLK
jgi:hypothetical protein